MDTDEIVVKAGPTEDDELVVAPEDQAENAVLQLKGYRQRTAEIRLKNEYDGMFVKVWINCPRDLLNRLSDADPKVGDAALAEFIVDHNLVLQNGERLPKPLEARHVRGLDTILITKIVRLGGEAIQKAAGLSPR